MTRSVTKCPNNRGKQSSRVVVVIVIVVVVVVVVVVVIVVVVVVLALVLVVVVVVVVVGAAVEVTPRRDGVTGVGGSYSLFHFYCINCFFSLAQHGQ